MQMCIKPKDADLYYFGYQGVQALANGRIIGPLYSNSQCPLPNNHYDEFGFGNKVISTNHV